MNSAQSQRLAEELAQFQLKQRQEVARKRWKVIQDSIAKEEKKKRNLVAHKLKQLSDEEVSAILAQLGMEPQQRKSCMTCFAVTCSASNALVDLLEFLTSDEMEHIVNLVNEII